MQPLRLRLHFGAWAFVEKTWGLEAAGAVFAVAAVVSLSWATMDWLYRGWSFVCRCPIHPMSLLAWNSISWCGAWCA